MPVSVHLSTQVIDVINDSIVAGLRADPGRGLEIGGILLGSVEPRPDLPPIIRIEKFDFVESEHRRGSSYDLTDRDKRVLGKKLAWWSKHGHKENLRPVGFFRSHTRRGLYLDNDDFLVLQHYFPEPHLVFLLVRPVPGAAGQGGFFFWQDGDIRREASFQEFPFSSAKLPLVIPPPAGHPTPVVSPTPLANVPQPRAIVPAYAALPASMPPSRKPAPTWLRLAIPVAIGMALGAVVFKVTTTEFSRLGAVRQTQQTQHVEKPAPDAPLAASAQPPPAAWPPVEAPVEKPSPLEPNPRPKAEPVQKAAKPAGREVAVHAASPAPAGNASREESGAVASESESGPAEPASAIPEKAPPPPAVFAPITTPARVENPQRAAAVATVTVEPVSGSKLGRIVGHLPGFRRRNKGFVPARPIRQITPSVPASEHLARDVPVDLKITVDPAGLVAEVEQTSRAGNQQLVRLAEDAARSWQFVPARRNDESVASELILHFMFRSTKAEP